LDNLELIKNNDYLYNWQEEWDIGMTLSKYSDAYNEKKDADVVMEVDDKVSNKLLSLALVFQAEFDKFKKNYTVRNRLIYIGMD
jgi:hypothetical protein